MIARHDEKTSVGRAKVLSGGDTGYRLAEVAVTASAHLVHLINSESTKQAAAEPQTKPTKLDHESTCRLLVPAPAITGPKVIT